MAALIPVEIQVFMTADIYFSFIENATGYFQDQCCPLQAGGALIEDGQIR